MSSLLKKSGLRKEADNKPSIMDEVKFQLANAAASSGLMAFSQVPATAYAHFGKDESALVENLMQDAYKRGLIDNGNFTIRNSIGKSNACFQMDKSWIDGKLRKGIVVSPLTKGRAGTVAHEIGHAESLGKKVTDIYNKTKNADKALSYGARAGKLGAITQVAALTNILGYGDMSDTAMNTVAGAGAAAMLPTIAEEAKASWNGYKLLRNAGKGRLGSALTFVGLPTYLAASATPFVPAVLSKYMDKK